MATPDEPGRRELTEQVLAAEQDERRRIALFLHDGPVQSLSGVALMLDAVSDFIARGREIEAQDTILTTGLSTNEITCLIVDDHEVVREGLRLSLSRAPHIRVIGEAADGETAVKLAERRRPNVVIMDVRMPGMDGLEATKLLTERVPDSAVLIFTAYSERSLLSRGLESGAKGYILKEAPHATLLRAIEKVAGGEGYVDPALMPEFLTGSQKDDMLTVREREILQLLADGMSNADVATKLFISQETVKSHVRHILAKLEADTRTHAVAIALREAIID
jgi:DNA-binding NarL/FixJ family response regulator